MDIDIDSDSIIANLLAELDQVRVSITQVLYRNEILAQEAELLKVKLKVARAEACLLKMQIKVGHE